MSIIERAMVINLQIGIWHGYKLDKQATSDLTASKNADEDAARVNTHLVSRASLKGVTTAANALRTLFYSRSLPWKDNGDRLITREIYTPFIMDYAKKEAEFYSACDDFAQKIYPSEMERASFRMGELFDASAYPTSDQVRRKFYAHLDIDAVSTAQDFRVQMDADELENIKLGITKNLNERVARATQDVWNRAYDLVQKLAKLSDESRRLHGSTFQSLEDLVEAMPSLNLTDDPDMDDLHRKMQAMLQGLSVDDVRKDVRIRETVSTEAQQIIDQMKGFMNAFSQAA